MSFVHFIKHITGQHLKFTKYGVGVQNNPVWRSGGPSPTHLAVGELFNTPGVPRFSPGL